jgi:hypothetical protein
MAAWYAFAAESSDFLNSSDCLSEIHPLMLHVNGVRIPGYAAGMADEYLFVRVVRSGGVPVAVKFTANRPPASVVLQAIEVVVLQ